MKPAFLQPEAACLRTVLFLLFLAAGSLADEPIATYNGSLSVGTNAGNVSGSTDMSNQITFNIQNPPSAPTPPADTYYPPSRAEEKVAYAPVKEVASEIKGDVVLKEALSEILGAPVTAEGIEKISEASAQVIAQVTTPSRSLDIGASTSTLSLLFEYRGTDTVQNFVVYDTVPKSFAGSAKKITVSAPGAVVRIVRDDPVYTFTYPELSPGQKVDIKYAVNARVSKSVLNDTKAPVLLAEKIKAAAAVPPPEEKPAPPAEEKPPAIPEKPPAAPEKPLEEIAKAPISKTIILLFIVIAIIAIAALRRRPAREVPRRIPPAEAPFEPPAKPAKKRRRAKGAAGKEVTILEE